MESLKRSIKYQLMESKSFIMKFWITVLLVDIFAFSLSYFGNTKVNMEFTLGNSEVSIVGVNIMIILITLIIYNFVSNYESFPIAISLSMTRKDYFISFLVENMFISFLFATIQGILFKIDPFFVKLIGKVQLNNFVFFNIKTDNIFFIIFSLFIIFLVFTSFWSLIASLNYKFGYKIWIIAVIVNVILFSFNIKVNWNPVKIFDKIPIIKIGVREYIILILGIVISYTINYLIVKRTNIKGKTN